MSNNYFDINKYNTNTVIHCKTVKEIKTLLDYLDAVGHQWCISYNKESAYAIAKELYSRYRENTCINFKLGCFAGVDFYERKGYTIFEFDDFNWFGLDDIKDGMCVITYDGERYIKLSSYLVGQSSRISLSNYDYLLRNTSNHHKNIVAVYSSDILYTYKGISDDFFNYTMNLSCGYAQSYCIYKKRQPITLKKLTVEQIEEKLGYPIEII